MTGIIIAAHGTLAQAALETVELLSGEKEEVMCISFKPGDSLEVLVERFQAAINALGKKDVLILTDVRGGSPCNVATLMQKTRETVRTLYGFNVGMLLQVFEGRDNGHGLETLVGEAVQAGQISIGQISLM